MKFWWVNQNQTFESEIGGGYLWSPKTRKDGGRNQFYENMKLVEPGDIIFSFFQQHIGAIGIAEARAFESNKPMEFGSSGDYWNVDGWKLPVRFYEVEHPFRPKEHMEQIGPLLPEKYAPIQPNGNGNQGAYLAALSDELGRLLLSLCDSEVSPAIDETQTIQIEMRTDIGPTTKLQLVQARRGQGVFRDNLMKVEKRCRVTGLAVQDYLVASHIKPWSKSNDDEKLDGHNGLLLAPHIDRLFDRGMISFENDGTLKASSSLPKEVADSWLSAPIGPAPFLSAQLPYLEYHRNHIFKG